MPKALEPPFLRNDKLLVSHAGGERQNKAGRPARKPARFSQSGSSATGAALIVGLLAGASPCLADDDDAAAPPKDWPPPIQMLSPSAPLDRKSKVSVGLVRRWQSRRVNPTLGQRGEVRFTYGATQDTVVCAPLRLCDIALQAGEIVQNVNLGDPVMWSCPPAVSGSGAAEVTHLMCKPADAGLATSLAVQTSRRSYSINLVSTRTDYMPLVAWNYPEDQAQQWAAYQQRGMGGSATSRRPCAAIHAEGYIHYSINGDNPPWRPIEAYSDGKKTCIRFPPAMAYGKAPVLDRLP
jgi:type IV secretion system protein TrbG